MSPFQAEKQYPFSRAAPKQIVILFKKNSIDIIRLQFCTYVL